jgi:magnesium transporter
MVIHAVDLSTAPRFPHHGTQSLHRRNFLVTFPDEPCAAAVVADRLQKKGHALPRSPDLLAYQILDLLFDNYQPALDELSAELAALEHRVLTGETQDVLAAVVNLQNEVQRLRQIMAPQRDVIARMMRGEFPKVIRPHLMPYLRDLQDNLSRIGDLAETYRESLTSTLQIHLNLQQMSINRVIKVLTILTALSTPVLLVTSGYGMNIQHMPNAEWPSWQWAYLYVFLLNGALILALYRFMKRHAGSRPAAKIALCSAAPCRMLRVFDHGVCV